MTSCTLNDAADDLSLLLYTNTTAKIQVHNHSHCNIYKYFNIPKQSIYLFNTMSTNLL